MPKRLWRELAEVPRKLFKTPPPLSQVIPADDALGDPRFARKGGFYALVPEMNDTYDSYGSHQAFWPIQEKGYSPEADFTGRDLQRNPPKLFPTQEEAATALHDLFDDDDNWQAYVVHLENL